MNTDSVIPVLKKLIITTRDQGGGNGDGWELLEAAGSHDRLFDALKVILRQDPTLLGPLHYMMHSCGAADGLDAMITQCPDADAVSSFITDATEGCIERLVSLGMPAEDAERLFTLVRVELFTGNASPAKLRVGIDFDGGSSMSCYDVTEVTTADLSTVLLAIAIAPGPLVAVLIPAKQEDVRVGPMYRYHPERMKASRHYFKQAIEIMGNAVFKNEEAAIASLNQQVGLIVEEANRGVFEFGIQMMGPAGNQQYIFSENDLFQFARLFVVDGRQIFDIPPRLVDMLAHSDVDDLQLNQLRTPYRMQYIHVGPRQGLELTPGWRFDGAYVMHSDGRIKVKLTAAPPTPKDLRRWVFEAEPTYDFTFEETDFALDIGTAVDVSVSRWLASLAEEGDNAPLRQVEANDLASDLGLAPGAVTITTQTRVAAETARVMSNKDAAHSALSLIVNALCYLTAYPDDIERTWQPETPQDIVEQASTGKTPGARRRAEQSLVSQGYGIVHLCGLQFRNDPGLQSAMDEHGNIKTHWRRGHFRNQAYGPKRRLRRLIWIMPILVNAEQMKAGEELHGHIYRASGEPSGELDA